MTFIKDKKTNSGGFTVMELLMVMSIMALISFTGIKSVLSAQEKAVLDDAESAVVRSLETAKNRAANGIGREDHGVYIEKDKVTIFEGEKYTGSGSKHIFHPAISADASGEEIIFERISGNASSPLTITLSDTKGHNTKITVTAGGSIASGN